MPYVNQAGIGVYNQYGARSTGNSVGTDHSQNASHELSLEFSGTSLADSLFVPPHVIPKGAKFTRATLVVHQPFTLTGTTPGLAVGGTAPATNGVPITAANLSAAASIDLTAALAGTWATASATGTTASEKVSIALTGTTPAVTSGVGKASLVINYIYKNRELGAVN
jgi:hypothetical protein